MVLVAVEKRGDVSGRMRMAVIPDIKQTTVLAVVKQHIAPSSTIYRDGLKDFDGVHAAGVGHVGRTQPGPDRPAGRGPLGRPARGSCHLQQWLIGTYHGVRTAQLQIYLDEFVFRHNRRRQPMAAFQTRLGLGTGRPPTPYRRIRGAQDLAPAL